MLRGRETPNGTELCTSSEPAQVSLRGSRLCRPRGTDGPLLTEVPGPTVAPLGGGGLVERPTLATFLVNGSQAN
jgi:hypothetical protein